MIFAMLSLVYILLVFLLVLANVFFVASGFALVGVRRSRIETLAASGNQKSSPRMAVIRRWQVFDGKSRTLIAGR
jgi:CBS domain containing-hemolysin-like protein